MLDDLKNRQRGCSIFLHQLVQEILNDVLFRFVAFPTRWRALAHRLIKRQRHRGFLIIIGVVAAMRLRLLNSTLASVFGFDVAIVRALAPFAEVAIAEAIGTRLIGKKSDDTVLRFAF